MLRPLPFLCLSVLLLASTGGCPTPNGGGNGGGGGGGSVDLVGTWEGTLDCERVQTVGTTDSAPVASTLSFSVTFGSDGLPESILILGFSDAPDADTTAVEVNDQQTLTGTTSSVSVTNVVRVSSADYQSDSADIAYSMTYSASGGNLTQAGTGTQTVTLTLVNGSLNVQIETVYDVTQTVSGLQLTSSETTICTGNLTRQ